MAPPAASSTTIAAEQSPRSSTIESKPRKQGSVYLASPSDPWGEWRNYKFDEWVHLIGYEAYGSEAVFGVLREYREYVRLNVGIQNFNALQPKCKLCRNSRGRTAQMQVVALGQPKC